MNPAYQTTSAYPPAISPQIAQLSLVRLFLNRAQLCHTGQRQSKPCQVVYRVPSSVVLAVFSARGKYFSGDCLTAAMQSSAARYKG